MNDSNVRYLPSVDELLRERFTAATATRTTSDWTDVRTRAVPLGYRGRRVSRWSYAAIAASLALTALVAPALGLTDRIVPFLTAASAPENVVVVFSEMNLMGDGRGPGAVASEARSVYVFELASGSYPLAVTPTSAGSFCWVISGFPGAGCQTNAGKIGMSWIDIPAPTMKQHPVLVSGNIRTSATDRLQIEFEDEHHETIPYLWVSEPINAGFFLYELPRERWQAGKRPIALALYNAEGTLLARNPFSVTESLELRGDSRVS